MIMKKMIRTIAYFIIVIAVCTVLFDRAHAATMTIESDEQTVVSGDVFRVTAFLDMDDTSINAIEGTIIFPMELLEVVDIREDASVVTFWLEKPKAEDGRIAFSGITPGGFSGSRETMLVFDFRAKAAGSGTISVDTLRALRNDGWGTELVMTTVPLALTVAPGLSGETIALLPDNDPPEDFIPVIVSDPNAFDGKPVLIFETKDKGSGISRYEVREGKWGLFTQAESPYVIRHPSRKQELFVKAIDRQGNERIAILTPAGNHADGTRARSFAFILAALGIIALCTLFFKRKK